MIFVIPSIVDSFLLFALWVQSVSYMLGENYHRFIIMRHEVYITYLTRCVPYNCFQILSQCTAAGLHRAGQLDQLVPADRCCEWDGRPVALGGSSVGQQIVGIEELLKEATTVVQYMGELLLCFSLGGVTTRAAIE